MLAQPGHALQVGVVERILVVQVVEVEKALEPAAGLEAQVRRTPWGKGVWGLSF